MQGIPTYEIATEPMKLGRINLQGGDRFDTEKLLKDGILGERVVRTLREVTRQVVPLSREAYGICMARRQPGEIGRGFTKALLVEHGIIDGDAVETPKAEKIAAPVEAMDYKGFKIIPRKNGRFTQYDVTNAAGELMRASRFRSVANAEKFVDDLPAGAGAAPQTEKKDGRDLQPGAPEPAGSGAIHAGGHEHQQS